MYDEKGTLDTLVLKKDKCGDFQLYTKDENHEIEEDWSFGIFLDKNIIFEIVMVEEKLTDDLKNALKVLRDNCKRRPCPTCVFYKKNHNSHCCDLMNGNPYYNYDKYVGE